MPEKTLSEEDAAKLQALVNTLPRRVRMLELRSSEVFTLAAVAHAPIAEPPKHPDASISAFPLARPLAALQKAKLVYLDRKDHVWRLTVKGMLFVCARWESLLRQVYGSEAGAIVALDPLPAWIPERLLVVREGAGVATAPPEPIDASARIAALIEWAAESAAAAEKREKSPDARDRSDAAFEKRVYLAIHGNLSSLHDALELADAYAPGDEPPLRMKVALDAALAEQTRLRRELEAWRDNARNHATDDLYRCGSVADRIDEILRGAPPDAPT